MSAKKGIARRRKLRSDQIIAYPYETEGARLTGNVIDEIRPCGARRSWMDETPHKFAYRCIPMASANTLGWEILSPVSCVIKWNGGQGTDAVSIQHKDTDYTNNPRSHFGSGILTWSVPMLFRTPPGVGMVATGPANNPKHGIIPLEAYIETDWLPHGFGMSWKILEPMREIEFEKGEPFCRIYPVRRDFIENMRIEVRSPNEDPDFCRRVSEWAGDREQGIIRKVENIPEIEKDAAGYWTGNYAHGADTRGKTTKEHKNIFRCKVPVDKR